MAEAYGTSTSYSQVSGQAAVPYAANPIRGRQPYSVVVVDSAGTRYADLENAAVETISWELSNDHIASFTLPTKDAKIGFLQVAEREVQIYRGRSLIYWGVVIRARAGKSTTSFQCVSLGWYFGKRVFGKIPKTNYISNGSMESGTTGWLPESVAGASFSVRQAVGQPVFSGSRSLRLSQNTAGADIWVRNSFLHTVPTTADRSDQVTVVAWVWVASFFGGAIQDRGLWVDVRDPNNSANRYSFAFTTITANTPRNKWVRMEVTVPVHPRSGAQQVNVRLYCPYATVYWDEVSVSIDERTAYRDADQASIVQGIVQHSQDAAFGKNSLNIGTNCPATSIRRSREYLHYEHGTVREALDEFPTLAQGVEWDIEITPTRRTFTSYFPRKGVVRPDLVLELGRNLVDFTVNVDGEETANKISVISAGEGADREEGSSSTTTLGGLVLEKVYQATPGSAPQSLNAQAARGVKRYSKPVVIPEIVTHEGAAALIGVINTGDVVIVRIDHGWIQVNGLYRIIKIDLNPTNDQLTFTINPAETSF